MKASKRFGTVIVVLALLLSAAVPASAIQAAGTPAYPYGLDSLVSDQVQARQMLRDEWAAWKAYYISTSGPVRVLTQDGYTTSESMGYGLLLSVYFDDQALFDDFYQYVKDSRDAKGLMNWQMKGMTITGANSDTGADCTIALALIFADSVWGSDGAVNYAAQAKSMLQNIRSLDFTGTDMNPGDSFTSPKFIAQMAPGWFHVFKDYSGEGSAPFWNEVIEKTHRLVFSATNPTTGLMPDRCYAPGTGFPTNNGSPEFGYDALQLVFKMAVTYSWYGDADAQRALSRTLIFFNNIGAENIVDGYALNGTPTGSNHAAAFVSAIAAGFMTGADRQQALDFYNEAYATTGVNCYNDTLRLLSLMYMTGNFQNLYEGGSQITASGQTPPTTDDPMKLTLNATGNAGYVRLTWNSVAGAKGYYVYKSTVTGGQTKTPETDFWVTGTTYDDIKINPGTKYYYIVRPVQQDNALGAASNEVSATPLGGSTIIELIIGDPNMRINGISKEIDPGKGTLPLIANGRTFLPIRAVVEELGGTIQWDSAERKITISLNGHIAELWIGSSNYTIDGAKMTLDVAPYISSTGRTMIPLRFIEGLGCVLVWEGGTVQKATIIYDGPITPKTDDTPVSGSWAGTWFTDYGRMELTQNGNKITGVYGTEKYTITGTVSGSKLTGIYNEYGSLGKLEFNLAADGSSFIGIFGNDETPKSEWSSWNGKREQDIFSAYLRTLTTPSNWSGTWETDYGTMVLTQNGTSVTGKYGDDGAYTITGTVSNNRLAGTYSEDGSVGYIEFYMMEDNQSFKGWFGDDQAPKQDWSTWDGQKAE